MYSLTERIIKLDKTIVTRDDVYAVQLEGGLYIPFMADAEGDIEGAVKESELEEGAEMPWMIDYKILYGKEEPTEMPVNPIELEEIYQHFRLTWANWYGAASPSFRKEVMEILFKDGIANMDLTTTEKRQRLFCKMGQEMLSWMDWSLPSINRKPSFKSEECRFITVKVSFNNLSVWRRGS